MSWGVQACVFLMLWVAREVVAQVSAPQCSAGWDWMYNSLHQSPCVVGAYIASVCNNGLFSVVPLPSGQHYVGPEAGLSSPCLCNTVSYSLFSACDLCQGGFPTTWSDWHLNCTAVSPDGVLEVDIPNSTKVPQWAFQNVTATNMWSNATAFSVGDGVESPAPSAINSSHGKSNVGPIVGGVVGGIGGAILLAGAIGFFIIRQRRRRLSHTAPSALYAQESLNNLNPNKAVYPVAGPEVPRRYYDPSDPATYPPMSQIPSSPPMHAQADEVPQEPMYGENGFIMQPNRVYTGLPEL
ncbi:hypothetical protein DENSPDRAFT_878916 [Dentipellis sp. KUC8613]|nr:hypothetical protein DENSPDRAFT_878916 [Dentipellis sp. KUC8613]